MESVCQKFFQQAALDPRRQGFALYLLNDTGLEEEILVKDEVWRERIYVEGQIEAFYCKNPSRRLDATPIALEMV